MPVASAEITACLSGVELALDQSQVTLPPAGWVVEMYDHIRLSELVCRGRQFTLKREVVFGLRRCDGAWAIQHSSLGIAAQGASREEALADVGEEFAMLWDEYANCPDSDLTADARDLKNLLLNLVEKVVQT